MSNAREALEMWNAAAAECGWPIVRRLTSDRERKLRALTGGNLDDWKEALTKAKASDFLCGRTERSEKHSGWRFSIDTMLRESFFVRLLEGNYDNREAAPIRTLDPETALWKARLKDYRPGGMWLGIWGPKPGDDGCQAPRMILEEWRQKNLN